MSHERHRSTTPPPVPVPHSSDPQRLASLLRAHGFTAREAAAWLEARPQVGVDAQVEVAKDWRASGFDALAAVRWYEAAIDPVDAVEWAAAGYTVEQAEYVQLVILLRHLDAKSDVYGVLDEEEMWRTSGLSPIWVCRTLGAGVRDIEQAREWQAASARDGGSVVFMMRILAGLAGRDFSHLEGRS